MSGRSSSSSSPWPSGSPGPRSSSRSLAARLGIFLLKVAILVPVLYYVWGYVQPAYGAAAAGVTNALIGLEEWGRRVTTLSPGRSDTGSFVINVFTTLKKGDLPVKSYDADLLTFYIVPALAIVLAWPEPKGWRRLRILVVTLAAIFVFQTFALLVTVEHSYAVVLDIEGIRYSARSTAAYTWLYETFVYLPIQLMTAVVVIYLTLRYGGLRSFFALRPATPADRASAPAGRSRLPALAAGGVLILLGAAATIGVKYHLHHVRQRQAADYCAAGWRALMAGSTEESSRLFKASIGLSPAFVQAWDGLGQARTIAGNPSQAEQAFREALALDGNYYPSQSGLGSALLSQHRIEEAIEVFSHARDVHPERWEAHYNLARALLEAKRAAEAETPLVKAVEMNPGMPDARLLLADLFGMSGRPCLALPHLEAFESLHPDSPKAAEVRKQLGPLRAWCSSRPAA